MASTRSSSGAGGAAEFLALIGLLNFEISAFKLGCTVPQMTALDVFWCTIAFLSIAAALLVLASGLFAVTRSEESPRLQAAGAGPL